MSDSAAYDQDATAADLYDGVPQYRERTDVAFFVDAATAAGSPILEIGCGTGRVLIPTARAGFDIVGLDACTEFHTPRLSCRIPENLARPHPAQTLQIYAHRQEVGMFRALFRLIVLMIVLVAVGGFFLGWWGGRAALPDSDAVATAGKSGVEQVKRASEEISQKTAAAAKTAGEVLSDGALTTKIKAKMGLDDTVKALDLNVDTIDGVVTVTGKVRSKAERDRALALARETNGVRQVIDRIVLEPR